MQKIGLLLLLGLGCWLAAPSLASATSLVVSQLGSGQVLRVDESGVATPLASGLDGPALLKYDQQGNLYVMEYYSLRVSRIDPSGNIATFGSELPSAIPDGMGGTTFPSYVDLTVSGDGRVFVLVTVYLGSPVLTEVWELRQDGPPVVIASFVAQTSHFTFGPGGHLYLAANGKSEYGSAFNNPRNHIIRVSLSGDVSSFYEFPQPNLDTDAINGANLLSVRFNSQGEMLLLTHNNTEGPNYRYIWKVQGGAASLFATLENGPGNATSGALTMTIDAEDNLYLVGGGSQCCPAEDGFIQKVDPLGNVITVALFPNTDLNAMFYIDDDAYDSYRQPNLLRSAKAGVFRSSVGTFYLDANGNGQWDGCGIDRCLRIGMDGDIPLLGDWDGSGTSKVGMFRPSDGTFYLDYNDDGIWDGCSVDRCLQVGLNSDIPLIGDWNGSGASKVGVFRPSDGTFYLDYNGNGVWDGCGVDRCLPIGLTGDVPLVGDWNGSGTAKVGAFRPSDGTFYLDYNGNGTVEGCAADRCIRIGLNGDIPLVGDWNGSGTGKVGLVRPSDGTFYLDYDGSGTWSGCAVDRCLQIGLNGDIPLVGDWNGIGSAKVGAFRPSDGTFYLDYNGNGVWEGCGLDRCLQIGMSGDTPLVGKW